jgi:hypothetical protein
MVQAAPADLRQAPTAATVQVVRQEALRCLVDQVVRLVVALWSGCTAAVVQAGRQEDPIRAEGPAVLRDGRTPVMVRADHQDHQVHVLRQVVRVHLVALSCAALFVDLLRLRMRSVSLPGSPNKMCLLHCGNKEPLLETARC